MEIVVGGIYAIGLILLHCFAYCCQTYGIPIALVLVLVGAFLFQHGMRYPTDRKGIFVAALLFFILAAGVLALTVGGQAILPPLRTW